METVLIVGAGLAGARCAETLRAEGFDGRIVLVGDEPYAPYERPALSKELLAGTRDERRAPARSFWAEQGIELRLGDPRRRSRPARPAPRSSAATSRVGHLRARHRRAPAPPAGAADARGRARAARAARPGRPARDRRRRLRRHRGRVDRLALGAEVTLVEAAEMPFEALLGREVGEALAARYRAHGLDLRTGTTELPPHDVAALRGRRRAGARARALARLRRLRAHGAPGRLRLRRRHRHRPLDGCGGTGCGRRPRDPRRGAALSASRRTSGRTSSACGSSSSASRGPRSGSSSRAATTRSGPAISTVRGACGRRSSPTARGRSLSCAAS